MATELQYTCVLCGQECLSESAMKRHIDCEHLTSQCCPICDVNCDSVDSLNRHINIGHRDIFTPEKRKSNSAISNEMTVNLPTPVSRSRSDIMDDIVTYTPDSALIRSLDFSAPQRKLKVNKETQTCDVIVYDPPMCLGGSVEASNAEYDCPICEYKVNVKCKIREHIYCSHFECEAVVSDDTKTDQYADYHCNYVAIPDIGDRDALCDPSQASLVDASDNTYDGRNMGVNTGVRDGDASSRTHRAGIKKLDAASQDDDRMRNTDSRHHTAVNAITGGASNPESRHIYENVDSVRIPDPEVIIINVSETPRGKTGKTRDIQPTFQSSSSSAARHQLYDCPFCGNKYDTLSSVEVHIDRVHPDALASGHYNPTAASHPHTCPMCGLNCDDVATMTQHVNTHFDASPSHSTSHAAVSSLDAKTGSDAGRSEGRSPTRTASLKEGCSEAGSYRSQGERSLSRSVYRGSLNLDQYYQHRALLHQENTFGVDDGSSCTKGLIGRLADFYHFLPPTLSAVRLCSYVDHYASSVGDKGWGCGYRNMQMLLSCLATNELYKDVLFNGCALIPSIPKIQRLIETAWQKGFDKQGAKQLNGQLVNTTKWVGATDIMATFQSLRVKCKLVDFHAPSASDGTHPKLFQWVVDYFHHPASAFLPPLFLQHQGHSRTIIGTERLGDGKVRLLVLDPGTSKSQIEKLKRKVNSDTLKCIRRTVSSLKAKQYQVLAVMGVIDNEEYDQYKILKSERV